jgi:N-acetyl-anhydromuramyl-L-alanine amidase AmpD
MGNVFLKYIKLYKKYVLLIFSFILCSSYINVFKIRSKHCYFKSKSFESSLSIKIIEKPIDYSDERTKLSLEYLKIRHGIVQQKPTIIPLIIVLHYTAGGTVNSIFNYFNNAKIEKKRIYNSQQSYLNVSAHYLIDRDGRIYHLVQDTLFARHTIGLNYCSIGIENIGSNDKPLTQEQVVSNSNLIRLLCNKFSIKYLIGHSEYSRFRKSRIWKEKDPNYFTNKTDPGDDFLVKVRKLIPDLKLKDTP